MKTMNILLELIVLTAVTGVAVGGLTEDFLSNSQVWYRFADLSDSSVGDSTPLTTAGTPPTVGNAAVIPAPGSNNQYADFPGDGYFRASPGDGTNGELELDYAAGFTALARVRFNDWGTQGGPDKIEYLFSKYEHKSGDLDRRLAFMRKENFTDSGTGITDIAQFAVQDGRDKSTGGTSGAIKLTTANSSFVGQSGVWYDFVGVFDNVNDTGDLYIIDSASRAVLEHISGVLDYNPQETDDPFLLGVRENFGSPMSTTFLDGQMEMFALWSRPLTESEVINLPEPATIGLLALGALGLLRRKK